MSYKFRLTNTFLKDKKKLEIEVRNRITKGMKEILENPYSAGIELVGNLKGLWKKRIGKYRIIYEIIESRKVVVFHSVKLRKKVYR